MTAEITQNHNNEVGMLIGANCIKALEPVKIIATRDGGPYAYKTNLLFKMYCWSNSEQQK